MTTEGKHSFRTVQAISKQPLSWPPWNTAGALVNKPLITTAEVAVKL